MIFKMYPVQITAQNQYCFLHRNVFFKAKPFFFINRLFVILLPYAFQFSRWFCNFPGPHRITAGSVVGSRALDSYLCLLTRITGVLLKTCVFFQTPVPGLLNQNLNFLKPLFLKSSTGSSSNWLYLGTMNTVYILKILYYESLLLKQSRA